MGNIPVCVSQAKEAEDYRKQANKCLQKTMTRWNPDFFRAAPLFEKVGVLILECHKRSPLLCRVNVTGRFRFCLLRIRHCFEYAASHK